MRNATRSRLTAQTDSRTGSIFVLATGIMIMLFAFAAFAVDISYITLTRAQLQKSADAAALAAVLEMGKGWGKGAELTPAEVSTACRTAARDVAFENEAGGLQNAYLDMNRDVRLGQLQWDPVAEEWVKLWGTAPYNLVEVTLHRDQAGSLDGDGPLDLFFAPIIGHRNANVHVKAVSAMKPGVGLKYIPGEKLAVLPFTLDVGTWNDFMANNSGNDEFGYNDESGNVFSGADGVKEIDLYPYGNPDLPAGNRGTVDFGHSGNSTDDINRQILDGLNEDDLSHFGGEIRFDELPMNLSGDTGISAGVKEELRAIRGEPRLLPLFSHVSGPGNNAVYTIVRFVPVRVMHVRLDGKPSGKRVLIQAAPFAEPTVITGETVITEDTIFGTGGLVR